MLTAPLGAGGGVKLDFSAAHFTADFMQPDERREMQMRLWLHDPPPPSRAAAPEWSVVIRHMMRLVVRVLV